MKIKIKIYIAGPDVFYPTDLDEGKIKVDLCSAYGFEGIYPSFLLPKNLFTDNYTQEKRAKIIKDQCVYGIQEADIIVANLSPFRGYEMDSGTAFELGFASALNKTIYGYTTDPRTYLQRMQEDTKGVYCDSNNTWRDKSNNVIENVGLVDNCMIGASCKAIIKPTQYIEKNSSNLLFTLTLSQIHQDLDLKINNSNNHAIIKLNNIKKYLHN